MLHTKKKRNRYQAVHIPGACVASRRWANSRGRNGKIKLLSQSLEQWPIKSEVRCSGWVWHTLKSNVALKCRKKLEENTALLCINFLFAIWEWNQRNIRIAGHEKPYRKSAGGMSESQMALVLSLQNLYWSESRVRRWRGIRELSFVNDIQCNWTALMNRGHDITYSWGCIFIQQVLIYRIDWGYAISLFRSVMEDCGKELALE